MPAMPDTDGVLRKLIGSVFMISAALDTSCGAAFAVERDGGTVLAARRPLTGRDSDRELVPWLLELLEKQGLTLRDIGCWTVGIGPGSFSGIRAGIALVRGICLVSGAVCRGMPGSAALAASAAARTPVGELIGVLHDARRGQVIFSPYRRVAAETLVTAAGDPTVIEPCDIGNCPCAWLATPHADSIRHVIPGAWQDRLLPVDGVDPRLLLAVAGPPAQACETGSDDSVEPVYVRPAVFVAPRPVAAGQPQTGP